MFRPGSNVTIPPMVSVFDANVGWADEANLGPPLSSTAAESVAHYFPIILPASCTVRRVWWANGSAVSGNVDVGLYADDGDRKPGVRLVSAGSTAQSGTNAVQFVDVTDTIIGPGLYWIAFVIDNTTGQVFRGATPGFGPMDAAMIMRQDSGIPLPATATPVQATGGSEYARLVGFSTVASP